MIQRGKTGVAQYVFALVHALARLPARHQFLLFVLEEDLPLFGDAPQAGFELVPVSERFRPPVRNIGWHQARLPARGLLNPPLTVPVTAASSVGLSSP